LFDQTAGNKEIELFLQSHLFVMQPLEGTVSFEEMVKKRSGLSAAATLKAIQIK